MQKIKITDCLFQDYVFVDTRSPSEYEIDHIPGSINIPILDDEERKNVGTLYKNDTDKAFELGIEYYGKKLPLFVSELKKLEKNKKIVVYCWRGGMRSKAVCQMVDLLKYDSYQLDGGYKAYREYVRDSLQSYVPKFKFIVLWGNTGCAKTTIIRKLENAIDLEGLAAHRSSLFGGIGLKPRKQKMFDSLLFRDLEKFKDLKYVFTEGESRKIGDVEISPAVYKAIKNGIHVRINATIENRVKNTVREYFLNEHLDDIKRISLKLKQWLSNEKVQEIINSVDSGDKTEAARILLEDYYDPRYKKVLDSVEYSHHFDSDDVDVCVEKLKELVD